LAARLLRGERVALRLSGDSMRPLLESGDTVILKAPDLRELGPGMIVAASYRQVLWLHRITEMGETPERDAWVGLRGDGARGPGERIPVSHILGVAETRVREGVSLLLKAALRSR
jgi:hypothetical protein